ncbi:hypothetical protein [Methanosarcina acetivorans]|nr:hypothetical protein [Methanosarcina acetivorans]
MKFDEVIIRGLIEEIETERLAKYRDVQQYVSEKQDILDGETVKLKIEGEDPEKVVAGVYRRSTLADGVCVCSAEIPIGVWEYINVGECIEGKAEK